MDEQTLFLAGAIFLAVLPITVARLGRSQGGGAWAFGWFFLYGCGVARFLSADYPSVLPLALIFGTAFAIFLIGGSLLFTKRVSRFPLRLAMVGIAIVAVQLPLMRFVENDETTAMGSALISTAAIVSSVLLLKPKGRAATMWERILGLSFPLIAAAATYQALALRIGPTASPNVLFWWLLVSNSVAFVQVSAFMASAKERVDDLRAEALRSRDAHAMAEARYRELTELASDLISEVDERGQILYANPAHESQLGFKPEEIMGKPVNVLFPDALSGENYVAFESVFAQSPHMQTVVMSRKDGEERVFECNIRPFALASGEKRLVVTSRDVTDRLAAERLREEGREELESLVEETSVALDVSMRELKQSQRLASIGTLASGIAHQINNPVGSIQMGAEYALLSEGADNEREIWREALQNDVDQAQRCGQIVRSMLQFARNEPTEKSEVDLSVILQRVCDQTDGYARNQLATIDTSGIEGPLNVLGSAIELEQALLNIVRNATESSADPVRVEIRAMREKGFARVIVSDDGRGMDQQDVDRAFDPFFTTRLGRGGTGLGLSVAHGVIANHGGALSIESKKEVGTTMKISIPLLVLDHEVLESSPN